ncbi:MAG: hypothetical protein PHD67_03910 [Oscillospiraceae bacterium]|nr:hypothetical protein [Oscillospiraceae bacterium]
MKRLICFLVACMMLFVMAGCARLPFGRASEAEPSQEPSQSQEEPSSEEPSSEESSSEEASSEASEPESAPAGAADVSGAVKGADTTETAPAALGQWTETAHYATEDKTYHTVYVRVNKVTTQTADGAYVQSVIDQHNGCSYDFEQIDVAQLDLPSDVELCVLDYEVYVPAEFPGPDYGIVAPTFSFSAQNVGGGGIPSADGASVYLGMGMMEDLNLEKDPAYEPGHTYAMRGVFAMVKGYEGYVLRYTSYPDGTKETSVDTMYYVCHKPF